MGLAWCNLLQVFSGFASRWHTLTYSIYNYIYDICFTLQWWMPCKFSSLHCRDECLVSSHPVHEVESATTTPTAPMTSCSSWCSSAPLSPWVTQELPIRSLSCSAETLWALSDCPTSILRLPASTLSGKSCCSPCCFLLAPTGPAKLFPLFWDCRATPSIPAIYRQHKRARIPQCSTCHRQERKQRVQSMPTELCSHCDSHGVLCFSNEIKS